MSQVAELWEELERTDSSSGAMVRRLAPTSKVDLFAAVELPGRARALYLEVSADALARGTEFPRATGFDVTVHRLEDSRIRIVVQLVEPRSADVFTVLVEDVVTQIQSAADERSCVVRLLQRVHRWQAFLQRYGASGLSDELQRGLYGELWLLREHLIPACGAEAAISGWSGPQGADQDFQLPGSAFEVETTVAGPHQRVWISNVRQLDGTGAGALVLAHLSLDARHGGAGGETLPGIVRIIRDRLAERAPSVIIEFNTRLEDAGYLDLHATRYAQVQFTTRSLSFFRVEERFPRLLEHDLPAGVGDVSYSIQLAMCRPFQIDDDTAHRLAGEATADA